MITSSIVTYVSSVLLVLAYFFFSANSAFLVCAAAANVLAFVFAGAVFRSYLQPWFIRLPRR